MFSKSSLVLDSLNLLDVVELGQLCCIFVLNLFPFLSFKPRSLLLSPNLVVDFHLIRINQRLAQIDLLHPELLVVLVEP